MPSYSMKYAALQNVENLLHPNPNFKSANLNIKFKAIQLLVLCDNTSEISCDDLKIQLTNIFLPKDSVFCFK